MFRSFFLRELSGNCNMKDERFCQIMSLLMLNVHSRDRDEILTLKHLSEMRNESCVNENCRIVFYQFAGNLASCPFLSRKLNVCNFLYHLESVQLLDELSESDKCSHLKNISRDISLYRNFVRRECKKGVSCLGDWYSWENVQTFEQFRHNISCQAKKDAQCG